MKKYNKGEWSEPYLLLKLLSDQKLYLGKENFEKIENIFYPILKVIHYEKKNSTEFSFEGDIILINGDSKTLHISKAKFKEICDITLDRINNVKSRSGTFAIPELMDFLKTLNINEVKAKSTSKHDITIQIQDPKTFLTPTLGFSIKSQLGRPSTLLNASKSTNFTYRLSQRINSEQINEINNTRKFADKFALFKKYNVDFQYENVDNEKFYINLQSIDFNFPKIVSDILLLYYANDISTENTIEKFIEKISLKNEFNYNLSLNPEIYKMIMKRFLSEYALGMQASKVWKREYQADGGYLVIREDGEIICYHFYFVKNFETYLFHNTKLETPDPNRYQMAEVYEEDGFQKMKLNLQIRFIK